MKFELAISELQRVQTRFQTNFDEVDLHSITQKEKMTFFINVYNMMVIHGHVVYGIQTNAFQRNSFFSKTKYQIGGSNYS